ncbi:MAG: UDP-N-acetylmuramoyl-L-alanyl-D-glutamate--2,6-diaminopimelate ligase [Deltaproteobacteria bacterium]|nr:UDP-N-acetylmuramoyl-L-alanyl-D-glutamate--2,6-diaminopimelate ligase [Deltaproteobacteria bacterium]
MKLTNLLESIPDHHLDGDGGVEIKGIAYDSREVREGYIFVAIRGHNQDGHAFLDEAAFRGAAALLGENFEGVSADIAKVRVRDSRDALSKISVRFYNEPCRDIELIGVTGTNGKTTTTYLIESILSVSGANPGVIGTINTRFRGDVRPSSVTTPESLDLMRVVREMADRGATHLVMEVSSHALDQGRAVDCPFSVGVFTNFTRDHLDYHHTMEEYFEAKSILFRGMIKDRHGRRGAAVINMDDPKGEVLRSISKNNVVTYGLGNECDVSAYDISADKTGLRATIRIPGGEIRAESSLLGLINLYNILAATAATIALDIDPVNIAEGIKALRSVPGRLELVGNKRGLTIVVDYSHTPDALIKAQNILKPLAKGRLITVFGCGGDRDRGKRPEMGIAAGEISDIAIITSDNPRTEEPGFIIGQIEEGIKKTASPRLEWGEVRGATGRGYLVEADRRRAIEKAVLMANEKDIILIAGKGHEDYQIVGRKKIHFDDRQEAELAAS